MDPPFRHAKSRAFISSVELSVGPGATAAPGGTSRCQKVPPVSRRLESPGSARGRAGSPSRVSLLLQAWEREIVEKTGSSPTAPTHREHSSSASLLKDFTAHGPIFSQVYAPAQRPRRQDERGKGGPGGDGSPSSAGTPREVPVHRESYVHGALLPTRPTERPVGAPGDGPGAPCAAGHSPAVPRARQVRVLRTGRDVAQGRGAPNGTHGPRQDGGGFAVPAVGRESSAGSTEAAGLLAEGSPEEKDSAQAEPTPLKAAGGAGDRPGDPQTSLASSSQCPSAGAGGQAALPGTGEGSVADVDGTIPATPPRTESPPGAGSIPENHPPEVSDGPEPSPETAASAKAEIEPEGDETMGDPQGTAQEAESSPEPPSEPPAPESPPDASEEDPELLVDMEIFVDTLRNMEPSEMRKAPKAPRQPRPSALGRCAALPPIHEDRVAPRLLARGPAARPEGAREEEEEIKNPYLSPEERAAARTLHGAPREGWAEGGSLLGTLGADESAKPVAGGPAERSVLFRGNGLADARREAAAAAAAPSGCRGMAAAAEVPPRSSPARPLGSSQHEGKEGSEKINTRPGKIILYSDAGFAGHKREIWDDIPDATSWELSHTISIRVIRGGWVMYEKPRFRGRKCVLAEGDVEIDNPWTARPFRIGSFKRVVRDYRSPEISLFAGENGQGARLRFSGSAEDTRQRGQAWLLYSKPFFDDDPYVLEPGGYPNLKAWGAKDPSICSMHPIRLGCPVVERPGEPQVLIYEAAAFQGRSFTISRDIYDLKRLSEPALPTVGSLRVLGGCWVGYEKEGFRGHQYLLEEGEYQDWRQWGGYSEELVSLRLIRTDFSDPALVLFEAMDFEEGASVELSEALPDTRLAGYGSVTQSVHVLSGVWVAYEGPNYSGEQYVLEKGVYRNCEDWGATDCRIASAQPILQVREHNLHFVSKILLFSEPDFLGDHVAFEEDQEALPEGFIPRSCRVRGGSWILLDGQDFAGEQHVLSEGEYPTLSAMGCLCSTAIRSLKRVPLFFSEPSIFLHGLECFEGKEIELNSEVRSLQAEGFNNHVLSVRVKGGIWVLCEHGDFRGRQWLLDCTEITNWLTYSGLQHVGSLYPIRQRRIYFRIRSRELELFLSVPDDVEDMKAGRVVVSSLSEQSSSVWYYEDGLIKNQVAPNMSLQVIGPAGKGAKAVLWSETRVPRQTWSVDSQGRIRSQMFEDMVLDVKGGRSYDRDHAIVWDTADERPTQLWDIQVL
uniref:Crystallin beta-gamma domain containing 2 n=1 Tax=Taeniopygia guttata TaxID=59729 RepID=A0A674HVF4_TAEGU